MFAIPLASSSGCQLSGEFGFLLARLEDARKSNFGPGHVLERYLRAIIERLPTFIGLIGLTESYVGEVNQLRIICSGELVSHPEPRLRLALQQYFRELSAACEQIGYPLLMNLPDVMRHLRHMLMNEMSSNQIQGLFSNNLLKASGTLYIVEKMVYDNANMLAALLPDLITMAQLVARFIRIPDPLMLELAEFLQVMNEMIPEYSLDRASFDQYIRDLTLACHDYVRQSSQSAALELAQRMSDLRFGAGRAALVRQALTNGNEASAHKSVKQKNKMAKNQALKVKQINSGSHVHRKGSQGRGPVQPKSVDAVQNRSQTKMARSLAKRKSKADRVNQLAPGTTVASSSRMFHGLPPKPVGPSNKHISASSMFNPHPNIDLQSSAALSDNL
ncbi:hypothetical protein RhiJN_26438 [Ceratobasidium sp. AG-Ba]|nr:hypothetical protein RhiJN_26438 [Ceratobasidium sp. AG-Ba]